MKYRITPVERGAYTFYQVEKKHLFCGWEYKELFTTIEKAENYIKMAKIIR